MPRLLPLLPLVAIAWSVPAIATDNLEVRAAEEALEAAQAGGDGAVLARLIAPEMLFVRGSGRVGGRQDYLDGFTAPGTRVEPIAVTDRLLLRIAPDTAIAGGEGRIKGVERGRPFANRFRFSNTFVQRDGRWLLAYAQVTGLPD